MPGQLAWAVESPGVVPILPILPIGLISATPQPATPPAFMKTARQNRRAAAFPTSCLPLLYVFTTADAIAILGSFAKRLPTLARRQ